jgi:hypothetical protein
MTIFTDSLFSALHSLLFTLYSLLIKELVIVYRNNADAPSLRDFSVGSVFSVYSVPPSVGSVAPYGNLGNACSGKPALSLSESIGSDTGH